MPAYTVASSQPLRPDCTSMKRTSSIFGGHTDEPPAVTVTPSSSTYRISFRPSSSVGGASSALASATHTNPITRTRSLGGAGGNNAIEEEQTDNGPASKKAKTGADSVGVGLSVDVSAVGGVVGDVSDEEDDFFACMAPSVGDRPISTKVASASFFQNLDRLNAETAAAAAATTGVSEEQSNGEPDALAPQYAPVAFPCAPLDWNIFSKIRFTSSTPFDWVDQPSLSDDADGLTAFLSASHGGATPCTCIDTSIRREFQHALLYATFPQMPFTKNHPLTAPFQIAIAKPSDQMNHTDQLAINYVKKMWIQWEDSFRSLYYRLRLPPSSESIIGHFYTIHRSPIPFTCLFLSADGEDDTRPSAIISRSNRALRGLLQKAGVEFTMPNSSRPERAQCDHNASDLPHVSHITIDPTEAELQAKMQQRIDAKFDKDTDLTAGSVLLVQGARPLHALYDFLLHLDRRELNIPTILASQAFLNSTPQQLNLVRVGSQFRSVGSRSDGILSGPKASSVVSTALSTAATVANTTTSGGASSPHLEYALDLTGPIMPASVVRLFNLFYQTQNGQFQAFLSSDLPGMNFNCIREALVRQHSQHAQRANAPTHQPRWNMAGI